MEMLDLAKKFQFLTCEYSESENKESYDVSLLLDGFETEWKMHKDSPKKVIKYVKLLKNETEHVTYALRPKMTEGLDVFDCKIHIKQEVSEDQEEDIKVLTSTEFDIHWMLPHLFKTSRETSDLGESSLMGGKSLVKNIQKKRKYIDDDDDDDDDDSSFHHGNPSTSKQIKLTPSNTSPAKRKNATSTKKWKTSDDEDDQLRWGPVSDQEREKQGDANYQTSGNLVHESPPLPVTDHRLEEQRGVHFQARRKSGHDPVATGDQDQGVTRTMENQALNQAHGDNQLVRLPAAVTHEIAGVLRQIPANSGNTNVTLNLQLVNQYYNSEKASMTHMKENDVTTSFHKHIPPRLKKRLNETLSQDDVWDQVKKMYGISDEAPRPPDIVSSLLSQVKGSIASFIIVLLKLKERHREGQQDIPQDLIDEVKDGLKSEMEYKKLKQNKIHFAEELYIDIGSILDYCNQDDMVPDEEITVLKNTAKENPRDACRKLFERLIASNPEKQPIKYLKDVLRKCQHWHLADELEVSHQDVEDELQKYEVGGYPATCEEPSAIGI
ncbi:uncharacterized protein LOC106163440 [Lingula anatina]|uniref:Uncharacterized protein LOC106163440 n=1 Tax=Lingula anatina TaxID=7574 RepID=A0A1S3IE18_LINAN|nr:uncharacterized protein LOC106163440 [Lingula anatina]|eukprot:XP_013396477.1 uncharacterized protein LOC106163440 [Lingula anatina]